MIENFQAAAERRKLESRMRHRQDAKDEGQRNAIGGKSKANIERDGEAARLRKLNYEESRKVTPLSAFVEEKKDDD